MATFMVPRKTSSFATPHKYICGAALVVFLIVCVWWTVADPWEGFLVLRDGASSSSLSGGRTFTTGEESLGSTFYDDKKTAYTVGKPIFGWDAKRREWFKRHPGFENGKDSRVLVITGSQPSQCRHPLGDRLLLRLFKNKVDYCRINGYGVFYNNAHLEPKMSFYWAKTPIVRAAMLAHPEVEWFFWVDSDAVFTDMEFKIPLEKYQDYNFVVAGKPDFYDDKDKSWLAVNAGVFLMRNCQWSIEFMEAWATMGPRSTNYVEWGQVMKSTFKDKVYSDSDDQSALVYLLLKERQIWSDKVYIENEYHMNGYWLYLVDKFDNLAKEYMEVEKREKNLRRRHAEVVSSSYASLREQYAKKGGAKGDGWRRPYITHFNGCQPCSGDHNASFKGDSCLVGLEKALNFADNQVLRNYGFIRPDISKGSYMRPVPFNFPGEELS